MNRYYVMKKKKAIPKALREQVWRKYIGEKFKHKCHISWCKNTITVFDFHVGHNKPESRGGKLVIFVVDAIIVWELITL